MVKKFHFIQWNTQYSILSIDSKLNPQQNDPYIIFRNVKRASLVCHNIYVPIIKRNRAGEKRSSKSSYENV